MAAAKRMLIAGIGNIFFGDDAFGCEVAGQLARKVWPEGIDVRDFGIRGLDLAYTLLEPIDHVVLIDAVARGGAPGTLYVIEPNVEVLNAPPGAAENLWDAHSMDPAKVLRLAKSLGAELGSIVLVGCEPTPFDPDVDLCDGLSQPVAAAVSEAVNLIESFVAQLTSTGQIDFTQSPATSHALQGKE